MSWFDDTMVLRESAHHTINFDTLKMLFMLVACLVFTYSGILPSFPIFEYYTSNCRYKYMEL